VRGTALTRIAREATTPALLIFAGEIATGAQATVEAPKA
jgi:hypothetical protein